MSRPLKFRAWDTVSKQYLKPYPEGFHLFGEVMCFDLIEQQLHELRGESYSLLSLNDVVVEQFTGLTDCKGKEIWEGDIVKRGMAGPTQEVYYDDTHAWFCYKTGDRAQSIGDSLRWSSGIGNHIEGEVLGNIHEHPDLLKKGATS